jgi:multifunctional beta-oxidation protein
MYPPCALLPRGQFLQRDIILYNLGVGATEKELQWTFEGHEDFAALPTFGVIPQFPCSTGLPMDWLPNYNPVRKLLADLSMRGC